MSFPPNMRPPMTAHVTLANPRAGSRPLESKAEHPPVIRRMEIVTLVLVSLGLIAAVAVLFLAKGVLSFRRSFLPVRDGVHGRRHHAVAGGELSGAARDSA